MTRAIETKKVSLMEEKILKRQRQWRQSEKLQNEERKKAKQSSESKNEPINQSADVSKTSNNAVVPQPNVSVVPFNNSFNTVKVFDNNQLIASITRSHHRRLKKFRLQDSIYNVSLKKKNNESVILLKDLLDTLKEILLQILKNIQSFYESNAENILYITLFQSPMINGLNSGPVVLQNSTDLEECVLHILDMLYRFKNIQTQESYLT